MSPTTFTERLLIVVRAPLREQANEVARVADPTTEGETFNVPLVAAADADVLAADVVAYWAGWTMTPDQRQRLLAEFGRRFARALDVIPVGATPRARDDFWLFDRAWDSGAVLRALGFALPLTED